ncbi:Y-family DNA polymerase [Filimonas effusa]|uniref:DNA polymerase Y family protein n=1 Tax=Filimonas effusa TaxID=2508721 RepID=A0A4Q1DAZ9_9BACT|nr:DNA polymerase Y family protein [Filimonas effusa]RXK85945.1 DNA polymerase Y family protein [Filimonas effusa]
MQQRFLSIWFRHLYANWCCRKNPALSSLPLVIAEPQQGRMVIVAVSAVASEQGIAENMTVADARVLCPALHVHDFRPELPQQLLTALGKWCIGFTPVTAIDPPNGLMLDISGCPHLWRGEGNYLKTIVTRLSHLGYDVRAAIAGTPATAWAVARFGQTTPIIPQEQQLQALLPLPPAALQLEQPVLDKMLKLGMYQVGSFIHMPRPVLRRRFGEHLLLRIDQALGYKPDPLLPLIPPNPWSERLPCIQPIVTAKGIEIAIQHLLERICHRLQHEGKGLRTATLKAWRADGQIRQISIGTSRPVSAIQHLFRLFELKIDTLEPGEGIERFVMEAPTVEDLPPAQECLWGGTGASAGQHLAELVDKLTGKLGINNVRRFLPQEHHWPERAVKKACSLNELPASTWNPQKRRPVFLLPTPEKIEVAAPVPDYPPMHFRYNNQLHKIKKADGPERIEREWWLEEGPHRDYYTVEDDQGNRYWLFRSGYYSAGKPHSWFIHGFFA